MEFTEVKINDVQDILEEMDQCGEFVMFKNFNKSVIEVMDGYSTSPDFHLFVLVQDGVQIALTSTFPNSVKGRISIGYTYVKTGYRGQGNGFTIRNDLVEWIKAQGFSEIYAKTWKGNVKMVALNKKMGFQLIEEVKGDRTDGDSTLKFLLKL